MPVRSAARIMADGGVYRLVDVIIWLQADSVIHDHPVGSNNDYVRER